MNSDLIGRQGFSAPDCALTQQALPDFFTARPQQGPWQLSASGLWWYSGSVTSSWSSSGVGVYQLQLGVGEAY